MLGPGVSRQRGPGGRAAHPRSAEGRCPRGRRSSEPSSYSRLARCSSRCFSWPAFPTSRYARAGSGPPTSSGPHSMSAWSRGPTGMAWRLARGDTRSSSAMRATRSGGTLPPCQPGPSSHPSPRRRHSAEAPRAVSPSITWLPAPLTVADHGQSRTSEPSARARRGNQRSCFASAWGPMGLQRSPSLSNDLRTRRRLRVRQATLDARGASPFSSARRSAEQIAPADPRGCAAMR